MLASTSTSHCTAKKAHSGARMQLFIRTCKWGSHSCNSSPMRRTTLLHGGILEFSTASALSAPSWFLQVQLQVQVLSCKAQTHHARASVSMQPQMCPRKTRLKHTHNTSYVAKAVPTPPKAQTHIFGDNATRRTVLALAALCTACLQPLALRNLEKHTAPVQGLPL